MSDKRMGRMGRMMLHMCRRTHSEPLTGAALIAQQCRSSVTPHTQRGCARSTTDVQGHGTQSKEGGDAVCQPQQLPLGVQLRKHVGSRTIGETSS